MAYDVRVDPERRLVEVRATGTVTDDDVLGIDNRMRSDPSIDPGFDQLVDASGATEAALTSKRIQTITASAPFLSTSSRRAIVAPTDLGFGMSRMFELYRGELAGEIRVFRTRSEALAWLGMPPE
jgi:hypothetical protein